MGNTPLSAIERLHLWAENDSARSLLIRNDGPDKWNLEAKSTGRIVFEFNDGAWHPLGEAATGLLAKLEAIGEDVPDS